MVRLGPLFVPPLPPDSSLKWVYDRRVAFKDSDILVPASMVIVSWAATLVRIAACSGSALKIASRSDPNQSWNSLRGFAGALQRLRDDAHIAASVEGSRSFRGL